MHSTMGDCRHVQEIQAGVVLCCTVQTHVRPAAIWPASPAAIWPASPAAFTIGLTCGLHRQPHLLPPPSVMHTACALSACGCHHDSPLTTPVQVCARCCLRLRLCYQDLKCPLCKQTNDEVVMLRPLQQQQPAPPAAPGSSSSADTAALAAAATPNFAALRAAPLWSKPRWARGVLVYEPPPDLSLLSLAQRGAPRKHVKPLHVLLLQMTSRACCECDASGKHPFPSDSDLQRHLAEVHRGRQLCWVCLKAGRMFCLDLPAYLPDALATHLATHPR